MGETVTIFRSLLRSSPGENPGENQRRASREFPGRIANSQMHWWSAGDPIHQVGRRLLIGVAVWSGYDLRLLDFIETSLRESIIEDIHVDVFNMDAIGPQYLFEPYIPGLGEIHHEPVVGLWINGILESRGAGYQGRKIVSEIFGFDMDSLVAFTSLTTAN